MRRRDTFRILFRESDEVKKHICFFSGDITNSGGTERVASIIMTELVRHFGEKYRVSAVSLAHKRAEPFFELDDNVSRFALYEKPVRGVTHILGICRRLSRLVKREKIDVLVDIDGILDMYSLPVKLRRGVRVVSWEHYNFYQNPIVPYRKLTRRLAARFADAIVTLTKEDEGYYRQNLKIRCPLVTIHNPVVLPERKPVYDSESKILLSVGRLTYQKGFDYLVETARQVMLDLPEWIWIILGEGEDRSMLEKKIKEYGLDKQVLRKGNVSNVDVYYQHAAAFVMTSRFEGLPMTLLEAKTFALPIVSFDCKTGPRDIVTDGVNGKLIEPFDTNAMADVLGALMKNKEQRVSWSMHTEDGMETFALDQIMKQWNAVFGEMF